MRESFEFDDLHYNSTLNNKNWKKNNRNAKEHKNGVGETMVCSCYMVICS